MSTSGTCLLFLLCLLCEEVNSPGLNNGVVLNREAVCVSEEPERRRRRGQLPSCLNPSVWGNVFEFKTTIDPDVRTEEKVAANLGRCLRSVLSADMQY